MLGSIGATELIVILILALIIFGPGKLPEVGKAIGRSFREFKRASQLTDEDDDNDGARKADRNEGESVSPKE